MPKGIKIILNKSFQDPFTPPYPGRVLCLNNINQFTHDLNFIYGL